VHHESIGQTLHDGALRLPEPLLVVAAEGVGKVGLVLELLFHCNVVLLLCEWQLSYYYEVVGVP
jgi:hypothetical protein